MVVRDATPSDADAIAGIYAHYVRTTVITFEEVPPTPKEIGRRMQDVQRNDLPWLVSENDGRVVGYAYATRWRQRAAYRRSVESTVYVDQSSRSVGVGTSLYRELIARLSQLDFHAVVGGIALPNEASVALHERLGFRKVAHFEEIGQKQKRWVDVGYWQLLLADTDGR